MKQVHAVLSFVQFIYKIVVMLCYMPLLLCFFPLFFIDGEIYYYIGQVTNGEGKVQDKSKMSTRYFSPSSLLFLFWESRCIALPYFYYFILFYFLETVGKTFCSLSSHYIIIFSWDKV